MLRETATIHASDRTYLVIGKPDEVGGLFEQLRVELRLRHYSPRTERAYVGWLERYIAFHSRRHPATLGAAELKTFLDALVQRKLAASSHQQALCALQFFYAKVLRIDPPWVQGLARPARQQRLPLVLSRDEVRTILAKMSGVTALMAGLLYGSGLQLLECARLRVKDVDFSAGQLTVRNGKGNRDRVTLLPTRLRASLHAHIEDVRRMHRKDLKAGAGYVSCPARSSASILSPIANGPGNGCFLRRATTATLAASFDATTFTKPSFSAPSTLLAKPPISPSPPPATPSATALPPIS